MNLILTGRSKSSDQCRCCKRGQKKRRYVRLRRGRAGGVSAIDKAVAPFGFTFCSKENVYEVALEAYQYTLNDGSVHTEYEMSVCVSIKPGNIFYRLYRTAKYLSGYCSCYGDFDSFEFMPTDAAKLHRMVSGLRLSTEEQTK